MQVPEPCLRPAAAAARLFKHCFDNSLPCAPLWRLSLSLHPATFHQSHFVRSRNCCMQNPLLRWAAIRWEIVYKGNIHAFAHDGVPSSPQTCVQWSVKQPDKQFKQAPGACIATVARAPEVSEAPSQAATRDEEGPSKFASTTSTGTGEGKKQRGSAKHSAPVFVGAGALEILEYRDGVVTLNNITAVPQMLDVCLSLHVLRLSCCCSLYLVCARLCPFQ